MTAPVLRADEIKALMFTTWHSPKTDRMYMLVDYNTREEDERTPGGFKTGGALITELIFVRVGGRRDNGLNIDVDSWLRMKDKTMVRVHAETFTDLISKYSIPKT